MCSRPVPTATKRTCLSCLRCADHHSCWMMLFAESVSARLAPSEPPLSTWEEQLMQVFILRRHIQVCSPISGFVWDDLPHLQIGAGVVSIHSVVDATIS